MIKKIKLALLACCISPVALAQSLADINTPKIVPPSPVAANVRPLLENVY